MSEKPIQRAPHQGTVTDNRSSVAVLSQQNVPRAVDPLRRPPL
jgi:hypothetical protein